MVHCRANSVVVGNAAGMQGVGDELLGSEGSVLVGGVNEVDSELDRSLTSVLALRVCGHSIESRPGDAHRSEVNAVDSEVAPDGKCLRSWSDCASRC